MLLRFLTLLAALIVLPGQSLANDLEGTWALRIDDANIFTFEISQSEDGDWQGVWTRPESFSSNGVVFTQMTGSEQLRAMAALEFAESIELSFDDPRPGAVPDIFRFRQLSENQAEMTYVGTDFEPYPLVRVSSGMPIGPFDQSRIYDRDNAVTQAEFAPQPGVVAEDSEESLDTGQNQAEPRVTADFLDGLDD